MFEELSSVVGVVIQGEKSSKRAPCVNPRWRLHLRASLVPPSLGGLSHPNHLSRLAILQGHVFSLKTRRVEHLGLSYGLFSHGACVVGHKGTEIRSHKDETFGEHKNPTVGFVPCKLSRADACIKRKKKPYEDSVADLWISNQDLGK